MVKKILTFQQSCQGSSISKEQFYQQLNSMAKTINFYPCFIHTSNNDARCIIDLYVRAKTIMFFRRKHRTEI